MRRIYSLLLALALACGTLGSSARPVVHPTEIPCWHVVGGKPVFRLLMDNVTYMTFGSSVYIWVKDGSGTLVASAIPASAVYSNPAGGWWYEFPAPTVPLPLEPCYSIHYEYDPGIDPGIFYGYFNTCKCDDPVMPCDATFNMLYPNIYVIGGSIPTRTFTVVNYDPSATYTWTIDEAVSTVTAASFTNTFGPGVHKVCLTVTTAAGTTCYYCRTFCVIPEEMIIVATSAELARIKPEVSAVDGVAGKAYTLYPNPASTDVTLSYFTNVDEKITLETVDMTGRVVQTITFNAVKGSNSFLISTSRLMSGNYTLHVSGNTDKRSIPFSVTK